MKKILVPFKDRPERAEFKDWKVRASRFLFIFWRLGFSQTRVETPNIGIAASLSSTTRNRVTVGLVGDTGCGKSSLLNALLDEEMLLPKNCFRASTAVPVEISWNTSTDWAETYRAEVDFISQDEVCGGVYSF